MTWISLGGDLNQRAQEEQRWHHPDLQTNHDSTRDGLSVGRGQAMASMGSRPLRCARMSGIALWVAQQAHCVDGMVRKAVPCISAMDQASAGRFGFGRSQRALATRLDDELV